jgi:predicted permease
MTAMLASIFVRIRALVNRRTADADIDDELRYHLERETERNVAKGMSPANARNAARRAFGNPTVYTESARDATRWTLLEELRQDAAYALRAFRRAPTFVATVVLTIGLGLGLVTAAFTLFDAYVLRPIAARDPSTLYTLVASTTTRRDYFFSWRETQAVAARHDVVDDVVAYSILIARFRGRPVFGQLVTGNYFEMLGVPPAIGRTLRPDDSRTPGEGAVVVLSHDMWTSTFGGDSTIVGSVIGINGVRLRVVGVMRSGFGGIESVPFDFWAPVTMADALDPARDFFGPKPGRGFRSIVRIKRGLSAEQATAALSTTIREVVAERGPTWKNASAALESHNGSIPLNAETLAVVVPMAIAFGLVLLIACANVANVMLARGMARQREIGVRLALGASRRRLIRQLLTESLLLSLPAAAASFVVSRATITLGISAMYASSPAGYSGYLRPVPLTPDSRLLAFIVIAALVAAVAFGLAPALQSTRPRIVHATRGDFDSNLRPSKLRSGLVVAQVGVSALLLVTAGVLLRAARDMDGISPGIHTADVLQLLPSEASREKVLAMLGAMPGVERVATAAERPLDGILPDATIGSARDSLKRAKYNVVSSEYFAVLGIPLVRGRMFSVEEAAGRQQVAIVSRAAAAWLWPEQDPIGQRLEWTAGASRRPGTTSAEGVVAHDATVVGVVADVSPGWIGLSREWPLVYFPQPIDAATSVAIVRVAGAADAALPSLERALSRDDSSSLQEIHSLSASLDVQRYPFHAAYWVASLLGIIALLLTATGVYGVVAYVVAQRTREFGVRLALGATRGAVVALVVRQLLRLAVAAAATGAVVALGVSRYLASQISFVDAYDPAGYAVGLAAVLLSCTAAAYIPSRRAASVNPVDALRADS